MSPLRFATPDRDLTEKDFSRLVYELCDSLGWRRYHTYRSERSQPGYPDETIVRERVVWLEIKTEAGKLSDAQIDWLRALRNAGQEVYLVRPRHLQTLARVLSARDPATGPDLGSRNADALELQAALDAAVARAAA